MYKTTKDKAYLYKFMLQSMCMLENRHDIAHVNNEPRWGDLTYEDGYIIGSMSRFVHYVLMEDSLIGKEKVYQFPEFATNTFNETFQTFNDFAFWLNSRLTESLDWFIHEGYWKDEFGFLDKPYAKDALILNKQIGFARAAFFLGSVNDNAEYQRKAAIVADLFKSTVQFTDFCAKKSYKAPVLQVTEDNAYWWYHYGWSVNLQRCKKLFKWKVSPSLAVYQSSYEDMSHGAVVLYVPIDHYYLNQNSPFNLEDMKRFRNTFVKSLYDGKGGFYNSVRKNDTLISDNHCRSDCPHSYHEMKALMYMNYADFDKYYPNELGAYEIIMNLYKSDLANSISIPNGYCCGMNKGHAEVVQAQWKRENIVLNLYQRQLVYDQNFTSSGSLTICPQSSLSAAYAEPFVSTETFTIEPLVKSEMKAVEKIQLKPGTHFKAGSSVHLKIEN
jgi:hypothetical protein